MERHHICPKAKDMFPEYSSFRENPWNFVCLTPRQHFIAHLILWKCFYDYKSQLIAINLMKRNSEVKNSRIYHKMRCDYKKMIVEVSKDQAFHLRGNNNPCHERIKDGTHIFLSPEFRKKNSNRMKKNNPMSIMKTNKGSFKKGHKPVINEERNKKISESKIGYKNPNFGKIGCANHLNNKNVQCPHCKIITNIGNAKRWHMDNCKKK
jgi:hypothetical protein